MRLRATPNISQVVVVDITDDDYKKLFDEKRPLNPIVLHSLIDAIALGNPRVIGVDIDTSAPQFKSFTTEVCWPPVVWEQEVVDLPESVEEKLEPVPVLGGRSLLTKETSALSLLVEDGDDKVTRRYRRCLPANETATLPSLPWSLYSRFNNSGVNELCGQSPEATEDFFIRYAGDSAGSHRIKLTAGKLLELSRDWEKEAHDGCNKTKGSPLEGKIVLLGGSYLGEDRHDTPLGRMNGVDIMASVIETEFMGGGLSAPGKLAIYFLEILSGFVLIIVFHQFGFTKALLFSTLAVPVLALGSSLLAFHSFSRWAYFAPMLLGVIIWESFVDFRNHWVTYTFDELRGPTPPDEG
jgi:CHASE2 domain-containing sensor protein